MTRTTGQTTVRRALKAALAAAAGVAATAVPAAAGTEIAAPPPLPPPASALHCHVEMDVSMDGRSFQTASRGAQTSCSGVLLGRPVAGGGTLPSATGTAKFLHLGTRVPPVLGNARVTLRAVSAALPLEPRYYTRLELSLTPVGVESAGFRGYTGTARVRGHEHAAAATIAFKPDQTTQQRRCCITGRLIIDLALWDARIGR